MPFRYNPITNNLDLVETSSSPTGDVAFISGDIGGMIPPNAAHNITISGGTSGAVFTGNVGTNTITESFNYLTIAPTDSGGINGVITISSAVGGFGLRIHDYGNPGIGLNNSNTFIGDRAGNFTNTGYGNIGIGDSLVLSNLTSGIFNTAVGHGSMIACTSGSRNTSIGDAALFQMTTGIYNIAIGDSAGGNYSGSESSNILLSADGVNGENNTIRIGTSGSGDQEQNRCFIAGIAGNTVGNLQAVTINTATGQMGSQAFPSSGVTGPVSSTDRAISTWNGTGGTALFNNSTAVIDSTGRMTNSAQPCFEAYVTTVIPDVTGDGTIYPIIFDTEVFDNGSNFNLATSVFTAASTGRYLFTFSVGLQQLLVGHTAQIIRLTTTLGNYDFGFCNPFACSALGGFFSTGDSIIVPMTATNTATLSIFVSGSTKTVDVLGTATTGNPLTTFSAVLLC